MSPAHGLGVRAEADSSHADRSLGLVCERMLSYSVWGQRRQVPGWTCGDAEGKECSRWRYFSPKDTPRSSLGLPGNWTLSANRAFAGGRREGSERRSSWVRAALRPMTGSREGQKRRHRQGGEAAWRRRQRQEGRSHQPRDAGSPRSWKRQVGPSLEPVEGVGPWDTWTSEAWPPGWGRVNACWRPPGYYSHRRLT